jgi:hypothetical protein
MTLKTYYSDRDVVRRITEYLGGRSLADATAVYIIRCNGFEHPPRDPVELGFYLARKLDIARSLWDRRSLIAHLDLEYVNFDFPAEPYIHPFRAYRLQESVRAAAAQILRVYGIEPLNTLSGRGHHVVWRLEQTSRAFRQLSELGRVHDHLLEHYAQGFLPKGERISPSLAKAFAGLGMLMEFLAQRLIESSFPSAVIPVEITDVVPGPQKRGREVISIDLSEYGDPLNTRLVRVPFSLYSKHRSSAALPAIVPIPFQHVSLEQAIRRMRDPAQAAALARHSSTQIPDSSRQTEAMVEDYLSSSLAVFHRSFYEVEQEPPERWPDSYDRASFADIPYCLRYILDHPNDLLLKPGAIRQVVRTLLAAGWHPHHISGLIRSKYERDYGWGNQWLVYDAATRADFYVRVFAGLIATGVDRLVDFNCLSSKEKGLCFAPSSRCGLSELGKTAIDAIGRNPS